MAVRLHDYQKDAVDRMKNGCILCGDVGSGKSLTALFYAFTKEQGKDIYIITTARKRDTHEWEEELGKFEKTDVEFTVDSWNNIKKYTEITDSFFLFDEQRVVGSGAWVKAFLKIAAKNDWVLLSATPGDTWMDYIPVFIANGYYQNRTEFIRRHVVFNRYSKYPRVDRYMEQGRLIRLRESLLINMDYRKPTESHVENVVVDFDKAAYRNVVSSRWNPFKECPIVNSSEYCQVLRRIVNTDEDRKLAVLDLCGRHPKVIIFYNYDYELALLKGLAWPKGTAVAEWNGHEHQPIPKSERWVYLVQYTAGAEGWNCTETDTIIFYSLNYSYKIMKQSAGRIDRVNTPFHDLYYYRLRSMAPIDRGIASALSHKKNFNEHGFFTS